MREITLEKGNVYEYSSSCCSAYCPSNICALIIISLSTVTHTGFLGGKQVKSGLKGKRAGEITRLKFDCVADIFKRKMCREKMAGASGGR